MKISKSMVTTSLELPGHTIVQSLGIVRGISVRSLSMGGSIAAGFRSMLGGSIERYVKLCEQTRQEAFDLLVEHAEEMGANAIVGMRYDANEVLEGVTEVLAYGTAVIVEKK